MLSLLLGTLVGEGLAQGPQSDPPGRRLTQLSLAQLGDVEITSVSKAPEKVLRTPAAIYVLTQEDIRRSGATSLPEILRLVPGVEVARINSDKWSLGIRGFGSRLSRSVLVLMDGRSVYTPLFAGVYWEVQDTLLEDIERIEVIRGPGGTIWGTNAVNGVINIITKSAKDTHGVLASTGGGNVDQGFVNFRFGAGGGDDLHYRVYGKAFTRGPQFHPDNSQFDDWRMAQGGFRADWDLYSRDTLTLQGDLYKGAAGAKVAISAYAPPSITNVEQNADLAGGNVMGRWQRALASGSDLQLQVYYDRSNREDVNFAEVRNTLDVDFIHHSAPWPRQDVIWGLGTRFSSSDTDLVVPTVVFAPAQFTDKVYTAFVQNEVMIAQDRLWLTVGSKFLHNNKSGFEFQPSVRLLGALSANQSVWAAATRAVRTPSRVEEHLQFTALLLPSLPAFLRLTGDGGFTSEEMIGYEAGYRTSINSNFYVDLAAFYNDYDDLLSVEANIPFIETSPSPLHVVLPVLLRNGLVGATTGVEIAPNWAPTNWLHLKSSYAYLNIDLRNKPGSVDGSSAKSTEGSSPRHQVVVQSLLDLPGNLELDLTYRYVSALPAQSVRSYSTADARIGWRLGRQFDLTFVGQNLFQPRHLEFRSDPGPQVGIKRSAYAKITWTYAPR